MRLFAHDEVPHLSVPADEMPRPWILPRVPSTHRDRLMRVATRAVRAFDPRIRVVSLRWVERRLIEEGRVRLQGHPLVCWRVESTDSAFEALERGPALIKGLHMFDFEDDPGVMSQGWLGPVKVAILNQLRDSLLDESPISSAREPPLGVGGDDRRLEQPTIHQVIVLVVRAAEVLVSPIDLLDFTERLLELRAAGWPLDEARRDAVAAVLAARFEPAGNEKKARAVVDAIKRLSLGRGLDERDHPLLWSAGLADRDPRIHLPLFDWIAEDNVVPNLEWRVLGSPAVAWPPSLRPSSPPPAVDSFTPLAHEMTAAALLDRLREGRDERWSQEERREAAGVLLEFAAEVDRERGHRQTRALLDRAAALHQAAARLLEAGGAPADAARALISAADRLRQANRLEDAEQAAGDAVLLAEGAPAALRARALLARADLRIRRDQWCSAAQDIDAALDAAGEMDHTERAHAFWKRALVRTNRRQFALAKEDFDSALQLFVEMNDDRSRARLLADRAISRIQDNAFDEGQEDARQALTLYEGTQRESIEPVSIADENTDGGVTEQETSAGGIAEDESGHAWALLMRGIGRLAQGNYRDAAADLEMAIRLFGQADDERGRAHALLKRGELRFRERDLLGAEADYDLALPLFTRLTDLWGCARAHARRGLCRIERGDFEGAEVDLSEAERFFRESAQAFGLDWIQLSWAKLRRAQGRLEEALSAAERARDACMALRVPGDPGGEAPSGDEAVRGRIRVDAWEAAEAYEELARIHEARGDSEAARDAANEARTLGKQVHNTSAYRAGKEILRRLGPRVEIRRS